MKKFIRIFLFVTFYFSTGITYVYSDSFEYNTYNNHGVIGLINTPTARFHEAGSYGINAYNGTPDQKVTITSSPYDWLEASLFYSNIKENPIDCSFKTCRKDKGFNFKFRLKEEGILPALALGINDIGIASFQLANTIQSIPYQKNKSLGSFIIIDINTNNTAGIGFIE